LVGSAELRRRQVDQFPVGRPQSDPAPVEIDKIGLDRARSGGFPLSLGLGFRNTRMDHRQRQGQNPIPHRAFLPMLHAATATRETKGVPFFKIFAACVQILDVS
jgi:hypothetical protein